MIQIGLGGWLTCRIWDGMRLLGTVRKVGRSPAYKRTFDGIFDGTLY